MMSDDIKAIRRHFKPIQPSVKVGNALITYTEMQPSDALRDYIYCYWRLETNMPLEEAYRYVVVSDGCIDIFFEADRPEASFIMGFCRKYVSFELEPEFSYIGVRFLPSFFPLLFGVDAQLLSNKFQDLSSVDANLAAWLGDLSDTKTVVSSFNAKFERVLGRLSTDDVDTRFYRAVSAILERHGNIDVEQEVVTGLSPRQLRRIFKRNIGTTPKAFANVVRFQHILNADPSKKSLKDNKIYYDAGFYDQAHFIKSFKNFYGVTPTEAFD